MIIIGTDYLCDMVDHTALANKQDAKAKSTYRPSVVGLTKRDKTVISNTVFPVLVELKCQFLKALPSSVSLRDRRKMMLSLNAASDAVLNMDALVFDCAE